MELETDSGMLNTPEAAQAIEKIKQSQAAQRNAMTAASQAEEAMLKALADIQVKVCLSQKWYGIARTHIQQGIMAMHRAIAKPSEK